MSTIAADNAANSYHCTKATY